jgi:SOS-response transcriptional repressor LexA
LRIAAELDHDKDTPRYLDDVIDIGEWTVNYPRPLILDGVLGWRDRLRMAIDKSGKKHSVVAAEAGITRATLSRVLTATHQNPTLDTIVKIAHAINESVGWILDEPSYVLSADEQRKLHDAVRILENSLRSASRQRPKGLAESNASAVGANREIPRAFAAAGARLVYEAAGDSMIGAGIADRDLLFVRPTNSIREASRKVVICRLGADEYVKHLDVRNGHIRLLSRNEHHGAIDVGDDDDFAVIGIVVGRAGAPVA